MRCPFCNYADSTVLDSRLSQGGATVRRRRNCRHCKRRFTTYERSEEILPLIIKRDGSREPFDRYKLYKGIAQACAKRPIKSEAMEAIVDAIERDLCEGRKREVSGTEIGEKVLEHLKNLDIVAYIRFASVYRQFNSGEEFLEALQGLLRESLGRKEEKEEKSR